MFGFSRGASRSAARGLVHSEGVVRDEELQGMRSPPIAPSQKGFPCEGLWVFWVPLGRWVRDILISLWQPITGGVPYEHVARRENIEIHFLGLWDTVAAYGLPIDELTIAFDKWVWPMKFEDTSLLERVRHARHALALDDERRTFHPIPWDERGEKKQRGKVDPIALRSRVPGSMPMSAADIPTMDSHSCRCAGDRRSGEEGAEVRKTHRRDLSVARIADWPAFTIHAGGPARYGAISHVMSSS